MKVLSAFALLLLSLGTLAAQETAPSCCGYTFFVTEGIQHFATPSDMKISGGRKPDDFKEQVYGRDFTASVPNLPAGKYTIEIELAETALKGPGRVMTITSGSTVLAKDLDVFVAAGGAGKMYKVTGAVDHADDSVDGPLKIHFVASSDNAFFNAIHILNASGQSIGCVAASNLVDLAVIKASVIPTVTAPPIYNDPTQPIDKRIDDLIRRMSLKEKVDQMVNNAAAIPRLGVPAYNYWSEALHGVARAGVATVFPQAIGLGAMWDNDLEHQIGTIIGIEGRAKYNDAIRNNEHGTYHGLTFWSPNINIFRDPRWGRGQETYGEDPFLTSRMGVAFIQGMQGDDPKYMMAMGCAKHFAVHSGPESLRHQFNAVISDDDLYDTYLPQFEAAVREGKVGGVMSAYNAVDGLACAADPFLLQDILRKKWGFRGYVTSDCDAVADIARGHHLAPDDETAAAMAVKAGTDVNCGNAYYALIKALNRGLLKESDINLALHHTLWTRFRLGLFDPPDQVAFSKIPMSEVNSPEHQATALKAAQESIVLLKNQNLLPLDKDKLKTIAVIGANASDTEMLHGNYNGDMASPVTILGGIQAAVGSGVTVFTAKGCPLAMSKDDTFSENSPDFQQAVQGAAKADVIVYVGGISPQLEGEEMQVNDVGFSGGDRTTVQLPEIQTKMLKALVATGKPVIFVNCSGSAMGMPWEVEHVPAIIQAWYPGQSGGTAVADVLFGAYNPAGRLPVTFYASDDDLPAFTDYNMTNRTYRYFKGKAEYPFGFGLSYTKFAYSGLQVTPRVSPRGTVQVNVKVANTGDRDGEEVVQVYYRNTHDFTDAPIRSLCAFKRVAIARGATETVALQIPAQTFRHWDDDKKSYVVDPGPYELQVGAYSGDVRLKGMVQVQ